MASTYSNLKFELIGTGDQSGTWGNTTNTNLGTAIDQAISGTASVTFSSADVTLTMTSTNASQQARNLRLTLTGTSGGNRNLIIPATSGGGAAFTKFYTISNGLADTVTVKNATGPTYDVPSGRVAQVFCTGTGVYPAIDYLSGAILSSAAVILGGTINGTPIGNISPSTGAFTTLSATAAITYGGVTLSNAVTGTGNMVLSASPSLTNPTLTGANGTIITLGEITTISATAATGTINYDVITQSVLYYTASATANWTVNFRGNSSTSLNTLMAVGETRSVTFFVTTGGVGRYNNAVTIDGSSVTPKWQGGAAPTTGNQSSIDIYTYSIVKTANATFTVFASQTRFA